MCLYHDHYHYLFLDENNENLAIAMDTIQLQDMSNCIITTRQLLPALLLICFHNTPQFGIRVASLYHYLIIFIVWNSYAKRNVSSSGDSFKSFECNSSSLVSDCGVAVCIFGCVGLVKEMLYLAVYDQVQVAEKSKTETSFLDALWRFRIAV